MKDERKICRTMQLKDDDFVLTCAVLIAAALSRDNDAHDLASRMPAMHMPAGSSGVPTRLSITIGCRRPN